MIFWPWEYLQKQQMTWKTSKMRGNPNEDEVKKLLKKLRALGVTVRYTNTEKIISSEEVTVDDTGVVLTSKF